MDELSTLTGLTLEEMRHHPELLINAFDQDHRILFWNRKCEELFSVEEGAALGRKLEDVVPYVKGNEKLTHLQRALRGKEVHIFNDSFDKRSGRYEQRVIPVKDASGKVIAALNIVRTHSSLVAGSLQLPLCKTTHAQV